MTNTNTITVTADNFDTVVASDTPTLVDFWAKWCGPCRFIGPILEEIGASHTGKLTVAKLNVDEHPDLAQKHDVMSIPTLVIFKDGVEKKRIVGARPKAVIEAEVAEFTT